MIQPREKERGEARRAERKPKYVRLLSVFVAWLLLCLTGCGYDASSSKEPFEQDPATTELVIDRTLAQAIRIAEGLPEDAPLTKDFAASVTELSLWDGVKINSLDGISQFTALERLTATETNCWDIGELALMPSLTSIDISWSYITEIPDFSGCPFLTELYLSANCITDVTPLCKAPSLRNVYLSNNRIVSVAPLKDITFLEGLCLDNNGIVDYAVIRDNRPLCEALDALSQAPFSDALKTEEKAKAIVEAEICATMTPEQKLARLYSYVIDHAVFYDGFRPAEAFGYGILFQGRGVCGDYAEALCLLARHAGLQCQVIYSDTHAFNAVELHGAWYLVDSLWDDTGGDWEYFGFSTETALSSPPHVYDTERYPVAAQALSPATQPESGHE